MLLRDALCFIGSITLVVGIDTVVEVDAEARAKNLGSMFSTIKKKIEAEKANENMDLLLQNLNRKLKNVDFRDRTQGEPLLANVTDLLTDVLGEFMLERNGQQGFLDGQAAAWTSCMPDLSNIFDLEAVTADAEVNHSTCRELQYNHTHDFFRECQELDDYLLGLTAVNCTLNPYSRIALPNWYTMLHAAYTYFNTRQTAYLTHRDECLAAITQKTLTKNRCDLLQFTYEDAFCIEHISRLTICDESYGCLQAVFVNGEGLVNNVMAMSDRRVSVVSLIFTVDCYITQFQDPNNTYSFEYIQDVVCGGANEILTNDSRVTAYANVLGFEWEIPSSCDSFQHTSYPGTEDWHSTYTLPDGISIVDTGRTCHNCWAGLNGREYCGNDVANGNWCMLFEKVNATSFDCRYSILGYSATQSYFNRTFSGIIVLGNNFQFAHHLPSGETGDRAGIQAATNYDKMLIYNSNDVFLGELLLTTGAGPLPGNYTGDYSTSLSDPGAR